MATQKPTATSNAVKTAEQNWNNFMMASKICGAAICIVLIIMALTLV